VHACSLALVCSLALAVTSLILQPRPAAGQGTRTVELLNVSYDP
jgi:hypothetical protein